LQKTIIPPICGPDYHCQRFYCGGWLGVAASGDAAIEGALKNNVLIVTAPRVISPTRIPGGLAEHPHDDLSHALFNNDTSYNIPSQHLCPITQEPPFDAVHFDVPTANGAMIPNQQFYERLALYQYNATPGTLSVRRNIIHPFICAPIARNRAWDLFRPVDPALQETLPREWLAVGHLLEDDNPLNHNN
jgi:hypothetical protein